MAVLAGESVEPQTRPKRRLSANRRETLAGYLFISPWLVGFLIFTIGAMI